MTTTKQKLFKNVLKIIFAFFVLVGIYIALLHFLNNSSGLTKCNELGDYVGGILNPLFTLLSTVAIIYLTYMISKNEDVKAVISIETQKRITLNQMRQDALNKLSDKLNLFVYDMNKMTITSPDDSNFVKKVLSKNNKEKNLEKITVWLVISSELENFLQLNYLFKGLFSKSDFLETFNSLREITLKLFEEQQTQLLIEWLDLEKYIELKQQIITQIGDYIYSEF